MRCVIAIDKGTTAIKAAVFDASTSAVLAASSRPTPVLDPSPDWYEEDMEQTFGAVVACICAAMANCGLAPLAWLDELTQDVLTDHSCKVSGNVAIPGVPLALLAWMKRHDPSRHIASRI